MRKLITLSLALALSLSLAACQKKETIPEVGEKNTGKVENIKNQDTNENTIDEEKLDEIEKETEEDDVLNNGSEKEKLNALIDKSDYISLVELSSTADNQMELRILTNFKGNLSNIEFESPKNLSPNKQYLIFYHDEEDGSIVPTNGKASIIEIKDSDDETLAKVQEKYAIHEGDPAEQKGDTEGKTTTRETKDSKKNTKTTNKE